MGCHTWFYKKMETPSNEVMYKAIKKYFDDGINFNYKLAYEGDRNDFNSKDVGESYILQYVKKFGALEDKKEDTEWLMDKYAILSHDEEIGRVRFVKGKGFFHEPDNSRLPHDFFRVRNYPDDMLFSYDETIEFINNPKNKCETYDWTFDELKEFWDKYPDGMIDFG